jgi:hypothetical protein
VFYIDREFYPEGECGGGGGGSGGCGGGGEACVRHREDAK